MTDFDKLIETQDLLCELLIHAQDQFVSEMEEQGEFKVDEEGNFVYKTGDEYSCLEDLLGNEPCLKEEYEAYIEEYKADIKN